MINDATDIRMRAEIMAGDKLTKMKSAGERLTSKDTLSRGSSVLPREAPTLSDLGVSKTQSSRWQALAALSPTEQEAKIEAAKRKAMSALDGAGKRTRVEMRVVDEKRVLSLVPTIGKFRTLVIDPPWDYEWLSLAGRAKPGYTTMSHQQLMDVDVSKWAEDNCHMYLWVTNNFMTRGIDLMSRWGFQHKTVLTWHKLSKTGKSSWFGLGSYFRNATEHVLFGVRGTLRTRVDNIPTWFEAPVGNHSEKPEVFYDIVRKASYLDAGEGFPRQERDHFIDLGLFAPSSLEAAE
jgi:N6-adenosine-specific RNA methylase IME4